MTAIAIPENNADLEDFLNDDAKVKAVAAEEGGLSRMIKSYAKVVAEKDPGIADQIREQTQLIFHEMMEANGLDGKKSKLNLNWTEPVQANPAAPRHRA